MSTPSPTPLVVEIARHLKTDGRFVMRVEPHGWHHGQLQAVVDVGWAACQAGRVLNRAVHLTTTREADGPGTYTVTAELALRRLA